MKIFRFCLSSLLLIGSMLSYANASIVGTWQGELVVTPDSHVVVQFILNAKEDNHYSAFLNVPNESSLRNIAANQVTLHNDVLTLVIDEVGGKFVGKLEQGALVGEWTQQGTSFPLNLKPYVKQPLSSKQVDDLTGEWHGTLNIPRTARKLDLVFHINVNDEQELVASMDSPDQSLSDITFDEVSFDDDFITLKVLNPEMSYHGILGPQGFVGEWTQGGSAPLNMVKGKYTGRGLDINEELREKLRGQWYGQVGSAITLVFRFEDLQNGTFGAYLDSPDQGRFNVPMSSIEFKDGKLQIKIDGYDSVFNGTVSESDINGDLVQGAQINRLSMQRGLYIPPSIDLPQDVQRHLLGKWKGKAGNTELLFNFLRDEQGDFRAYLDIPAQHLKHLPLGGVSLDDSADKLSFVVKGIGAQFEGKAGSDEITGLWTMPGFQFPLELEKIVR